MGTKVFPFTKLKPLITNWEKRKKGGVREMDSWWENRCKRNGAIRGSKDCCK